MSTAPAAENTNGVFYPAIALELIAASKTNPRKHFDDTALTELAASIREKGVIEPIIVREIIQVGSTDARYEIVAGERRWRASKTAGASTIPALCRELDDKAVLEIQVIENLQRAEVHELDEAEGYRSLIASHGYEPETIAAKVGKSASYVYQRLKLASLIPEAQKLFFDGVINAGHAILIARLSPNEQKEVVSKNDGILWSDGWYQDDDPHACSVRGLTKNIRDNLYLDLGKAPWKQNDTKLLPDAGPCTTCPKRTGANPGLFSDIAEKNICSDRSCYNQKLDAFMNRQIQDGGLIKISNEYKSSKKADVIPQGQYREIHSKEDRCKSTQKAIVVEGFGRGIAKDVCVDKKCVKHQSSTARAQSGAADTYQAKLRQEQKKRTVEIELRFRILEVVLQKAPSQLKRADLELIAKSAWKRLMNATQRLVMTAHPVIEPIKSNGGFECDKPAFKYIDSATDPELTKFMFATALGPELDVPSWGAPEKAEMLLAVAKRFKVDVKKIESKLKEELKAKAKKSKPQTSAKSKSKDMDLEDDSLEDKDQEMDE